jgi:hypothetical protein
MTWSYSGDPGDGGVDEVRFLVMDTDVADQLISNEEIEYIITKWTPVYGSPLMSASMVAEAISAKFTREVGYSADGVSVQVEALQQKYNDLASSLRDQYRQYDIGAGPVVEGVLYAEYLDPTIQPTMFGIGMNDNVRAGNQEYGGRRSGYGPYDVGDGPDVPEVSP